jgi:hypothetical protein
LQRHATSTEIQYWTTQLQSNAISPGGLMVNLMGSNDFMTLIMHVAGLA